MDKFTDNSNRARQREYQNGHAKSVAISTLGSRALPSREKGKGDQMGKHTPGPWQKRAGCGTSFDIHADMWAVCSGLSEADADFIIKAVNSHDEMLEALIQVKRLNAKQDSDIEWLCKIAIAKAGGRS